MTLDILLSHIPVTPRLISVTVFILATIISTTFVFHILFSENS